MLGFLAIIVILLPAMRFASLICDNSSVTQQMKVPRLLETSLILWNLSSLKKKKKTSKIHIQESVFFVCQMNQFKISRITEGGYTYAAVVCLFLRRLPRKKLLCTQVLLVLLSAACLPSSLVKLDANFVFFYAL